MQPALPQRAQRSRLLTLAHRADMLARFIGDAGLGGERLAAENLRDELLRMAEPRRRRLRALP